jgi:excisionase family DNA binding protein
MEKAVRDDDRCERGSNAIDRIADGLKILLGIWLDVQRDQGERAGAVEVREIAPAPILSDKRELTVKELAARWGVSTRSIYEWTATGGLPFKKRGRLLRFDWIEVDQWEKRHRESFTRARLRVVK